MKAINGFSKLSKTAKISWIAEHFFDNPAEAEQVFLNWHHQDTTAQRVLDGITENALANFPLPFSVAPNFLINNRLYAVPMVIEESSVVAAASNAAKFWLHQGGFHAEVTDMEKIGQLHFRWKGRPERMQLLFPNIEKYLLNQCSSLTASMQKRGGGVRRLELLDMTDQEPFYFQIRAAFDTCDSMGANFINSVLEKFADSLTAFFMEFPGLQDAEREVDILMSILSNYTPDCRVHAWVEAPLEAFDALGATYGFEARELTERFAAAVRIAKLDPYRAVTHNKGIYNGIDAVVLATGNDFRAVEACGHAYACRDGRYRSLSRCSIENNVFRFELEVPLALGAVGGLTNIHPLARLALEMLGRPSARELMMIAGAVGLAQNFAAIRSLVTTGIQHGHMKMHLSNILIHLNATETETTDAVAYFKNHPVSFSAVREFVEQQRATK